jgi:hypothetical protein
MHNDLLCYKDASGQFLVEIPDELVENVIAMNHSALGSGHHGVDRTQRRIAEKYHFPKSAQLIKEFCASCSECLRFKGFANQPANTLKYPLAVLPFQRVSMDILGPLKVTPEHNKYILVFTDQLTRYSELIPIADRYSTTIARKMVERLFTSHSVPNVLISDNAPEFTSELFKELATLSRLKKVEITAWHPSANALVERQNAKITAYLKSIVNISQTDWDVCLPWAQIAINSAYNATLGDTPHFVLYHYDKRLPYDFSSGQDSPMPRITTEYNCELYERAAKIFELARIHLEEKTEDYQMAQHKRTNAGHRVIRPGYRCYIKATKPPGMTKKFAPTWSGPYRIIKDLGYNRYEVVSLSTQKHRIVHADNIKLALEPHRPGEIAPRRRAGQQTPKARENVIPAIAPQAQQVEDESDDESEYNGATHHHTPPRLVQRPLAPAAPVAQRMPMRNAPPVELRYPLAQRAPPPQAVPQQRAPPPQAVPQVNSPQHQQDAQLVSPPRSDRGNNSSGSSRVPNTPRSNTSSDGSSPSSPSQGSRGEVTPPPRRPPPNSPLTSSNDEGMPTPIDNRRQDPTYRPWPRPGQGQPLNN